MEHAGSVPAVVNPHTEDLRQLVSRPGPFATAIIARPEPIEKAVEAAVNDARRSLIDTVAEAAADELADVVRTVFPHEPGLVAVVEDGRVVLVEALDHAP